MNEIKWLSDANGNRCSVQYFGSEEAAMQIYKASGFPINPARFYDDGASAMADMKRLADAEIAAMVSE